MSSVGTSATNAVQPGLAKRALAGHRSIGLIASALLYIVALSGTVVVTAERWQRWEQPNVTEYEAIGPAAVQDAMRATLKLETGRPKTAHLYVRLPDADLPRAVVTTDNAAWYVDKAGKPVAREAHSWTEFLLALHINLTLPVVWGMLLVGALGVAMAALTVTGVLALPKIWRDAFRLRSRHDPQVARADWHNRLGTWTLPFALTIALTGAFIGLSYAGAGLLAHAEGSDTESIYAHIFGEEPATDAAPAALADAARALRQMEARFPGVRVTYVIVHDPLTRGQFVQVLGEHPRRLIYGESYRFDASGNYVGKVGLSDGPIGRQAAASTYNLHFGNYAGPAVELAYVTLGLAICVVIATGTTLWLNKRQRKGFATARLEAGWSAVIWGTPLALNLAIWERWLFGPKTPLAMLFWLPLAGGIAVSAALPPRAVERWLRATLAAALAATGIGHAAVFVADRPWVLLLDSALMLAAICLVAIRRARTGTSWCDAASTPPALRTR